MKISLQNLSFSQGKKSIFCGLNFEFTTGQKYFISGPSGCGKSSLLRFISTLKSATSGNIFVNDKPITNFCDHRKNCQLLLQHPIFFDGTVEQNLQLALQSQTLDKELIKTLITQLFPEGLSIKQNALELSGGQQHRLSLLHSFLLKPQALLCDEISAGLDRESRIICEDFIINNFKQTTIIFVSHITESFAQNKSFFRLHMNSNGLNRAV